MADEDILHAVTMHSLWRTPEKILTVVAIHAMPPTPIYRRLLKP